MDNLPFTFFWIVLLFGISRRKILSSARMPNERNFLDKPTAQSFFQRINYLIIFLNIFSN